MAEDRYDVCVIGAGPGGSAAACRLAAAGVKTLLIDRARFPRDKVCGDGVGPRAVRVLEKLGLHEASVFQRFFRLQGVRIVSPSRYYMEVPLDDDPEVGPGYVIPRKVLDDFVLQEAIRRGAVFQGGFHIRKLKKEREAVSLSGIRGGIEVSATARWVIGAWGGQAGGLNLLHPPSPRAGRYSVAAVRAYYQGLENLGRFMEIHFDPDLVPGYGWVFPTGPDSANIGFGMRLDFLRRKGIPLRKLFERFLEANPFVCGRLDNATRLGPLRGARIPFRRLGQPLGRGRLLLVGDAAGLADPLSGEGIGLAMESGLLAAECAERALRNGLSPGECLRSYEQACRQGITRNLFFAGLIQSLLCSPPGTSSERVLDAFVKRAQSNPGMARAMARLVVGDLSRGVILKRSVWKKLWNAFRGS